MKKIFVILLALGLWSCGNESGVASDSSGGVGQGGSLARFAIVDDHLYAVDGSKLKVFSLNDPEDPVYLSDHNLFTTVETIFPRDSVTLFIGSVSGMFIYDVSKAPNIEQLSRYDHLTACDPVVANDKYAYVTLRSESGNNFCWRSVNQLEVIDIQDLRNPKLINTFPLVNPIGLGLYGDTLLVCDAGIKVFDVANPMDLKLLDADEDFDAFDIIPYGDLMILVSEDGLQQYQFKGGKLHFLSRI